MNNTLSRPRLHLPTSRRKQLDLLAGQMKQKYPDLHIIWTTEEETPVLYMNKGLISVIEGEATTRAFTNLV